MLSNHDFALRGHCSCFKTERALVLKTHICIILFFLASLIAGSRGATAQLAGDGAIQGRVTDPSGAVIKDAGVTVTNIATGVVTTRTTTATGLYVVSPIPAGTYNVKVIAPGFETSVRENITVDATKSVGLDVRMAIGAVDTVEVTSAPPALDTTNASLGGTIENATYSSLPLVINGAPRDPTAFAGLLPGVSAGGPSGVFNGQGGAGGRVNEFYVDGIPMTQINQQGNAGVISGSISVDAVDQFQVITSGASAQYTGLGVSNFNIKSGTNSFHGSVADFVRNTAFDSWGFFAKAATVPVAGGGTRPAPKPAEHQNEFSATLGGPIRKNKLFFFVDYDLYHQSLGVNPGLFSIPTLLERQGNFTELSYPIYDPTSYAACTAAHGGTACVNQFHAPVNGVDTLNVIPQAQLSPQSLKMLQFMPNPTSSGTQNNFLSGLPSGTNHWETTDKIDYQFTQHQRLSGLLTFGTSNPVGVGSGLPAPYSNGRVSTGSNVTAILTHTFIFSDHLVNNLKYAFVRSGGQNLDPWQGQPQYSASSLVGIGNLQPGQASDTFPNVSFAGFADSPTNWPTSANNSYAQYVNTYDIVENLQYTRGSHNITGGFLFQWLDQNDGTLTPTNPLPLNYNSVNTAGYSNGVIQNTKTGNSAASFMLGAINSSSVSVQPFQQLGARFKSFSPNIQDDWRVNSRLNLNLGLRWDIFTPYHEVLDRWSYEDFNAINPATNTPGAIVFAGHGPNSCNCSTPVPTYLGNIGPRLGLAYTINDKTVFRAAFSTVYSHTGGVGGASGANYGTGQTGLTGTASFPSSGQSGAIPAFYLNSALSSPYGNSNFPAFTSTSNVTPNRTPQVNAGNYIDANGNAVTAQGVSYANPDLARRAIYAENWNVGFQRAVTKAMTLNVNYSGSESHFAFGGLEGTVANQIDPRYEVLGNLLKQLPGSLDKATGRTYLQDAQAIVPGIGLPYANFSGPQATIQAMLLPHPQYGTVSNPWGNAGNSHYHSLQLSLSQRHVHGFDYALNYTFSKTIGDLNTFRSGYDLPASVMTDGIARRKFQLDRGLDPGSVPNLLRAYGVWDLPFGRGRRFLNQNHVVSAVVGGWSFSSIFTFNSGSPLQVTASGCQVVGQGTCMPSYTAGYAKNPRMNGKWGQGITAATASKTPFIDASAFTVPNVTYQIGNAPLAGAYGLTGPGYKNLDASLRRSFSIWREIKLIVQADVFNVSNSVRFNVASSSVTPTTTTTGQTTNSIGTNTSSTFGTLSSQANTARDFQFSGHINF